MIDLLSPEFPDLTISKLRFLESRGLVDPDRTPSGYRTYATDDIERLRWILTAQRERFWPLKVIQDALDAMDRGLEPPVGIEDSRARVPSLDLGDGLPQAADLVTSRQLRMTAHELADATGLAFELVPELVSYGLVHPDQDGHFGEAALAVATAVGGLTRYGLEPRHLRSFRTAADREIDLANQAVGPVKAGEEDRRAEVLRLCIALHTGLVREGLARL